LNVKIDKFKGIFNKNKTLPEGKEDINIENEIKVNTNFTNNLIDKTYTPEEVSTNTEKTNEKTNIEKKVNEYSK